MEIEEATASTSDSVTQQRGRLRNVSLKDRLVVRFMAFFFAALGLALFIGLIYIVYLIAVYKYKK
uniref:CSON014670 protein n=1 Tax=Culicoides sonorensis TaxID=179676 RepID=A0A336MBG2_CULSO